MYLSHFGLKEFPFSIAPDPRYLFMSEQHREALAHLLYGINSDGGFVLLTGDVGTGKTTVSRCFLEQLPDNVNIALILNPKVTVEELLATICDELGISYPSGCSSVKVFVDAINAFLLDAHASGKKTVLLIDEAQNLRPDVLEQIRLLTNLETDRQKLLQIVMIGQPELRSMLAKPELVQLSQRITARFHLGPLSSEEVAAYVRHRLFIAGTSAPIFPNSTIKVLYRLSRGIPRLVNIICDRALLGTYVEGKSCVDRSIIRRAAREVSGLTLARRKPLLKWVIACLVVVACGTAIAATLYYRKTLMPPSTENDTMGGGIAVRRTAANAAFLWPSGEAIEQSKLAAYRALLREWEIPRRLDNPDDLCRYVAEERLRCFEREGDMESLLLFNRPAVVKLADGERGEFFILLRRLADGTARIVVGEMTTSVAREEIETRWTGTFLILWKTPREYRGTVYPGFRGPIVRWLEARLSMLEKREPKGASVEIYDTELVRRVRRFQERVGLESDGIVGSQTFIALLNETGTDEPMLTK